MNGDNDNEQSTTAPGRSTFQSRAGLTGWCVRCGVHEREHHQDGACPSVFEEVATMMDLDAEELQASKAKCPIHGVTLSRRFGCTLCSPAAAGALAGIPRRSALTGQLRVELEGCRPPVELDGETAVPCQFCGRQIIGVRIVVTREGSRWVQVAAGAWICMSQPEPTAIAVRCAGCLVPQL